MHRSLWLAAEKKHKSGGNKSHNIIEGTDCVDFEWINVRGHSGWMFGNNRPFIRPSSINLEMGELTAESNRAQAFELLMIDDRSDFAGGTPQPKAYVGQRLERLLLGSHSCPCINTRGVRWLAV
jgi:hypothetical protein